MDFRSRSTVSLIVTSVCAISLIFFLFGFTNDDNQSWFPQTVVTLAALVGASWFAGYRLDLFDKDISQRQTSANEQINESKHTNFNDAVQKAVSMISSKKTSSVLAGQRWLHSIASVGPTEANLVQSILCSYLTNTPDVEPRDTPTDSIVKLRQTALSLLFSSYSNKLFSECATVPDLDSTDFRGLNFTDLDFRGTSFTKSNFINATVVGSCFDTCDLRETQWSNVGGNSRTSMCEAKLCGTVVSSAEFTNIDFTSANLSNNGRRTGFRFCKFVECNFTRSDWTGAMFENCTFVQCDFEGSIWNGATLNTPQFDQCSTVTFDLCHTARLYNPAGLLTSVLENLREKGLLNDSPVET